MSFHAALQSDKGSDHPKLFSIQSFIHSNNSSSYALGSHGIFYHIMTKTNFELISFELEIFVPQGCASSDWTEIPLIVL